ncbi:MAG: efflux transporter periplasmic adaptor subunit [Rhodobacterales bacterium]|nr:MAG: efflux transporter periplasmic adaptor subunit [Rhodobacterales bacterium]
MRLSSLLTAIVVCVLLILVVFRRDVLLDFAGITPPPAPMAVPEPEPAPDAVRVIAATLRARDVADGIVLRGRTEAARQVVVRAETSGTVVSEPRRKGAEISEGALLCEIDPGTRQSVLDEARAREVEAQARLQEAQARLLSATGGREEAEGRLTEAQGRLEETGAREAAAQAALIQAQGRVPEARAVLAEAEARKREAELNLNAAQKLSAEGFASDTRLANAEAALESALAGIQRAQSGVTTAEAGIASAEAGIAGAKAQTTSARAGITSARAGITAAEAQISSAEAGITGAQAGLESARAAIAAAEAEIDRLSITAPFAGLLESDTAERGSLLQPGGECATIIRLDPMKLVGFLPETDLGRIKLGGQAAARLASGKEVTGAVSFVARSADPATRTFRVEVEIPNPDGAIRDGQTAEIIVASDARSAHLVPQSALTLNDAGDLGVRLVADDSTARFAPVSLLRDSVDGVLVAGLPDPARVITVGQEYVTDGVPVLPSEPDQ